MTSVMGLNLIDECNLQYVACLISHYNPINHVIRAYTEEYYYQVLLPHAHISFLNMCWCTITFQEFYAAMCQYYLVLSTQSDFIWDLFWNLYLIKK